MQTTEIDLTIKDLSDRANLTPRMLNIYRADAEARLGKKFGYKIGRTWYFRPDEVREILKQREGNESTSQNFRETTFTSPNFSNANTQAETEVLSGMDAIVASGDQNAINIGNALGQRWNQLLWASAIQSMQTGMVTMQQQFSELHTSVSLELNSQPQLTGSPDLPALTEVDEL
jgi:hypothetical protein